MAKSKLRLDTRRALKDGTYPIQIAVGYGTNIYLSTGVFLLPSEWDDLARKAVGKSARRINQTLESLLTRIANRILELRESGKWETLTRAQLKQMLLNPDLEAPTVGVPSLGDLFERVIATKSGGTATLFRQTFKKVQAFCDPYSVWFDRITKLWLDSFYASMDGLTVNSRSAHMRNLRTVANYAIDEKITQNYPFRNYHIQSEETAMRVLPVDKMRKLMSLELTARGSEYRDMFLLSFYLIGINLVDLGSLTTANIVNGRLEYRRAKTGKFYSIKIEPEAWDIINRYKGGRHLLSPFDGYSDYRGYMSHLNKALAKIGPVKTVHGRKQYTANHLPLMTPLEPGLTSYWARYSWATYAADLDIPKDTISEALGHKYGSSVTGIYVKFSRDKVDAANRKVMDYVLGKSE